MEQKFNPLIAQEEPEFFKAQRVKNDTSMKELQELQRLCYEVFIVSTHGKQLYETLAEKYLVPAMLSPYDANAERLCMYWEGFKAAIRGLRDNGLAHVKKV